MQKDDKLRRERQRSVYNGEFFGFCCTNVLLPGSTYIEFDDVEVPVQNLVGPENEGFAIIMSSRFILSDLSRPQS